MENHDTSETEECDDRAQVEDNFYIRERITGEEAAGRASFGPGLFYVVRYGSNIEFVCIDTSKEGFFRNHRLFEFPKHWEFIEQSFPPNDGDPTWRIPFAHHSKSHSGVELRRNRPAARGYLTFALCSPMVPAFREAVYG